ncbi:MAG: SMI1/KNR4 family protein [Anaerolineae bacterium]|nr:SMI1/KNR4 family protein [Anaerolineae bacterium]
MDPPPQDLPLDELVTQIRHEAARILGWSQRQPQGCTNNDLERLCEAQGIAHLPETYCRVMRSVGRTGLDEVLSKKATYEHVLKMKEPFASKAAENKQPVPDDAFVFDVVTETSFLFFRTGDHDDNPAVYLFETRTNFFRFTERLSDYLREVLDRNYRRQQVRVYRRYLNQYQYDPAGRSFYLLPQPDENPSLDRVREVIAGRWFWEKRQGCTEDELEALQQRQSVNCLPEVYCQLMLEIGRQSIEFVLGQGANFSAMMRIDKASLLQAAYPPDAFVLASQPDPYGNVFFVRTSGGKADPPVYVARPRGLYQAADCLSRFMLQRLDENTPRQNYHEDQWFRRPVHYDLDRDELLATI